MRSVHAIAGLTSLPTLRLAFRNAGRGRGGAMAIRLKYKDRNGQIGRVAWSPGDSDRMGWSASAFRPA